MHEVLVNRLGGLSLPRKSAVRLTDRHDMTLDVYHGRKTTMQQQQRNLPIGQSQVRSCLKRAGLITATDQTVRAVHICNSCYFPHLISNVAIRMKAL